MANVTIRPVDKPKSFADVKFTQADWEAAAKAGPKTVARVTAMEALRYSKGLYQLQAEKKAELDLKIGGMSVDEMSNMELKLTATRLGVTIRKKNIKRSELIELVRRKLDEVVVEDDDEDIDTDSDERSPSSE